MIIESVEGGRSEQMADKKGGRFQGRCGMQKEEPAVGYGTGGTCFLSYGSVADNGSYGIRNIFWIQAYLYPH